MQILKVVDKYLKCLLAILNKAYIWNNTRIFKFWMMKVKNDAKVKLISILDLTHTISL